MNKLLAVKIGLLVPLILTIIVSLFRLESSQWDFWVYYDAAKGFLWGYNPYRLEPEFIRISSLDFTYLPLTLFFFVPFALLPTKVAAVCWLTLKLVALFLFVRIVQKHFWEPKREITVFDQSNFALGVLLYGLNAAMFWDLVSGNTAIFQFTLVWIAFLFLAQGRDWTFALIIVMISQLKLLPILFLGLLLAKKNSRWNVFTIGVIAFLLLFAANWIIFPQMSEQFFEAIRGRALEGSIVEPSSAAYFWSFNDIINSLSIIPFKNTYGLPIIFYSLFLIVVLTITVLIWMKKKEELQNDPKLLISLFVLTYCLLAPRVKSYGFVLALPAILYIWQSVVARWKHQGIVLVLLFIPVIMTVEKTVPNITSSFLVGPIKKMVWLQYQYLPLVTVFLLWLLLILHLLNGLKKAPSNA